MKNGIGAKVVQVILLFVAVGAVGYWPTAHFGADKGVSAMMLAGLVCLGAGLLSLIPMNLAAHKDQAALMHAWMIGTLMRIFIVFVSACVVYFIMQPARMVYAFWLVIFYIVFLLWDVWTAVQIFRKMEKKKSDLVSRNTGNE